MTAECSVLCASSVIHRAITGAVNVRFRKWTRRFLGRSPGPWVCDFVAKKYKWLMKEWNRSVIKGLRQFLTVNGATMARPQKDWSFSLRRFGCWLLFWWIAGVCCFALSDYFCAFDGCRAASCWEMKFCVQDCRALLFEIGRTFRAVMWVWFSDPLTVDFGGGDYQDSRIELRILFEARCTDEC